jgi:hypothetical protein
VDELRAAYLAALMPMQAKGVEKLDDADMAADAFLLCGAYLVVATEAAQARKKSRSGVHCSARK